MWTKGSGFESGPGHGFKEEELISSTGSLFAAISVSSSVLATSSLTGFAFLLVRCLAPGLLSGPRRLGAAS